MEPSKWNLIVSQNKIDVRSSECETTSDSSQELGSKLRLDEFEVSYKFDPVSIIPTTWLIGQLSATSEEGNNSKSDPEQFLNHFFLSPIIFLMQNHET